MIRKIRAFLARPMVHRFCFMVFLISTMFTFTVALTGCAVPLWLSDAGNIMPILLSTATSVLGFIGTISGNPEIAVAMGLINTYMTDVENGLKELEELIGEYNETPNETVFQKIQGVAALVSQNLTLILEATGLPAAVATKIQSFATLILGQLNSWLSLLPTLSAKAGEKVTLTVPLTKKEYAAMYNKVREEATGDPVVDAALAKMKKL